MPAVRHFQHQDDIAKVAIFAGMQILEGYNGHLRQLINLYYFKKNKKVIGDRRSPTAGVRFMEVRNSEDRQRSAYFFMDDS